MTLDQDFYNRRAIHGRNPLLDRNLIFGKLQVGDEIMLLFKPKTFRPAAVGVVVTKRTRGSITVSNGCCLHTYRLGEIKRIEVLKSNGNDNR